MARDKLSASDHLDKVALVVAFLAGAVGAWFIKLLGYGPFWAAGWTVGAMLLYVLAVTLLGRLKIEPEAIGDNCYYLGFLLTLASLSVTLYQLSQGEDQIELMRSIISGFGIALVSTILGILLRVIFIQLRPDIVARDRQTRIELQQAARDLRLELASSVAAIKEFSTEAIQVAAEQAAKITDATNTAVEVQRGRMQSDVEVYSETLRTSLKSAGEQAAKAIAESVKAAGRAAQTSTTASLDELSQAVAAYSRAQRSALEAKEATNAGTAATAAATLEQASQLVQQIEDVSIRLSVALDGIAKNLARGIDVIEAAQQRVSNHEQNADRSAAAAAASANAAAVSADAATEAASTAEDVTRPKPSGIFGWTR